MLRQVLFFCVSEYLFDALLFHSPVNENAVNGDETRVSETYWPILLVTEIVLHFFIQ
jgi:hypothetical protein